MLFIRQPAMRAGVNRDEAGLLLENDLARVIERLPKTLVKRGYPFWNALSRLGGLPLSGGY
jgi:hypothetical protein